MYAAMMSLRHALLGLLARSPASGYDLLQWFDESVNNVWSASQTQVYTELTRLDREGLIAASESGPRRRKGYAVTAAGDAELRNWLTATESTRPPRNEMLLRVSFLGSLSRQQALDYLVGIQGRARMEQDGLTAVEKSAEWGGNNVGFCGRLALEWGRRYWAMSSEWARWAQDQIVERPWQESGRSLGDMGSLHPVER